MKRSTFDIDKKVLVDFARRHHIRKLSLFGSVLRDDFGPQSDLDVLVEFEDKHVPGYFDFFGMQDELADLVGRPVDLVTPMGLKERLRQRIIDSSVPQYVAGG